LSLVVTRRKERGEGRKGLSSSKASHFCHREGHWKNDCKYRQEWLKKMGQDAEAEVASSVEDTELLMATYEDNTSQGKGWIFDSDSMVHVCSQKEFFNNFLIAKEEGIVRMVDGSACEVIDTGIVKVTGRDRTVRTLEAVMYVPEVRYNLISIRVLDIKGCRIQVQKGVVTVSQGDRVIPEGEKCGRLYKLKEGHSV